MLSYWTISSPNSLIVFQISFAIFRCLTSVRLRTQSLCVGSRVMFVFSFSINFLCLSSVCIFFIFALLCLPSFPNFIIFNSLGLNFSSFSHFWFEHIRTQVPDLLPLPTLFDFASALANTVLFKTHQPPPSLSSPPPPSPPFLSLSLFHHFWFFTLVTGFAFASTRYFTTAHFNYCPFGTTLLFSFFSKWKVITIV